MGVDDQDGENRLHVHAQILRNLDVAGGGVCRCFRTPQSKEMSR
jgi:hypothetical protein